MADQTADPIARLSTAPAAPIPSLLEDTAEDDVEMFAIATPEAGIHASWRGDLYAVIGDQLKDGAYSIRLYFNPLVRLIWLGALVMFFGGAVSLSDRRLRVGAPKPARMKRVLQPAE